MAKAKPPTLAHPKGKFRPARTQGGWRFVAFGLRGDGTVIKCELYKDGKPVVAGTIFEHLPASLSDFWVAGFPDVSAHGGKHKLVVTPGVGDAVPYDVEISDPNGVPPQDRPLLDGLTISYPQPHDHYVCASFVSYGATPDTDHDVAAAVYRADTSIPFSTKVKDGTTIYQPSTTQGFWALAFSNLDGTYDLQATQANWQQPASDLAVSADNCNA